MKLAFTWDPSKEQHNRRKHRVGFAEAVTVFLDPLARIFDDPDHSADEHREIIVGHSDGRQLLLVVFVERERDTIRIISARPATPAERHDYQESIPH
ncbi:MAG TPA: BrnT family toxin [Solimonas sp.]|nr:BrnT family toxin [Solimonas sp.]